MEHISPDGKWFWDGREWRPTSAEGQHWWDGHGWQPLRQTVPVMPYGPNSPMVVALLERIRAADSSAWLTFSSWVGGVYLSHTKADAWTREMHKFATGKEWVETRDLMHGLESIEAAVAAATGLRAQLERAQTDASRLMLELPASVAAATSTFVAPRPSFFRRQKPPLEASAYVVALGAGALVLREHLSEEQFDGAYMFAEHLAPIKTVALQSPGTEPKGAPPESSDPARWRAWIEQFDCRNLGISTELIAAVGSTVYERTGHIGMARTAAMSACSPEEVGRFRALVRGELWGDAQAQLDTILGPRGDLMSLFGLRMATSPYLAFANAEPTSPFNRNHQSAEICSAILEVASEDHAEVGGAIWRLARHQQESSSDVALALGRLAVHVWWSPRQSLFRACAAWQAILYAKSGRPDNSVWLIDWILVSLGKNVEDIPGYALEDSDYLNLLESADSLVGSRDALTGAIHFARAEHLRRQGPEVAALAIAANDEAIEILASQSVERDTLVKLFEA